MLHSRSLRVTATLVVASLLGCRNGTVAAPVITWLSPPGCTRPIGVEVSSGVTPIFSWTPDCGISALTVTSVPAATGATESAVWAFSVPESNPLGSGIRYGEAPTGARVWTAAQSLRGGTTYRVSVILTVGLDGIVASGSRTFVP